MFRIFQFLSLSELWRASYGDCAFFSPSSSLQRPMAPSLFSLISANIIPPSLQFFCSFSVFNSLSLSPSLLCAISSQDSYTVSFFPAISFLANQHVFSSIRLCSFYINFYCSFLSFLLYFLSLDLPSSNCNPIFISLLSSALFPHNTNLFHVYPMQYFFY